MWRSSFSIIALLFLTGCGHSTLKVDIKPEGEITLFPLEKILLSSHVQQSRGGVQYFWHASCGKIFCPTCSRTSFRTPARTGECLASLEVIDGDGDSAFDSRTIYVIASLSNLQPVVHEIVFPQEALFTSQSVPLSAIAGDPEGGFLTYRWQVSGGKIEGKGSGINWITPSIPGTYIITVTAFDLEGLGGGKSLSLTIQ